MHRKLFFYLFISLFLYNCESDKPKKDPINLTQELKSDCKSLLIVAEDRSGSTSNHRKLTAQDYKKIITQFQEKANGQVAIRVIGNPAPAEKEFFILQVEAQKPFLEIPKDALMSKKGKLRKDNEKIALKNKDMAAKNKRAASNFVASKITQHVLNYKPYKGRDLTDIENALHHIETKIKEPTFRDFDKIQVLIVSDGKHDATKLKEKLHFNPSTNLDLYLIGWQDQSVFSNVTNIDSFESVDGFISYYKTLKCE
jgi:hypothetical protein